MAVYAWFDQLTKERQFELIPELATGARVEGSRIEEAVIKARLLPVLEELE
jgi:hypothetical protein